MVIVVMGVTGSGKTTVGAMLAGRLGVPFADADDFHSPANVAKMSAGIPLDDTDRLPWLRAVGAWLALHTATGSVALHTATESVAGHIGTGAVVGCSALKRAYRDVLREAVPEVSFLHLAGDAAVIRRRVAGRPGHFMPESLVASQFADLEPLEPGERGLTLDLSLPVGDLVDAYLRATGAPPPPHQHTPRTPGE
jgi:gluconokinase